MTSVPVPPELEVILSGIQVIQLTEAESELFMATWRARLQAAQSEAQAARLAAFPTPKP